MVLPFQQIRSTAHGPMENPGWNELIELHRNDLVTLPAQEIHHGFPSEMCLNMMDLSLHCIDLTNQNGHLSAKAELQWNISPTNFYLIWYASYIYIMYIMSVSENGAYTAYRKNSKKNMEMLKYQDDGNMIKPLDSGIALLKPTKIPTSTLW